MLTWCRAASDCVSDAAGKVLMESIIETKSSHRPGIHPGTAWQLMGNLRGRDQCSLAVRLAEAARDQSGVVCDPRKNALLKAGNKERSGGAPN